MPIRQQPEVSNKKTRGLPIGKKASAAVAILLLLFFLIVGTSYYLTNKNIVKEEATPNRIVNAKKRMNHQPSKENISFQIDEVQPVDENKVLAAQLENQINPDQNIMIGSINIPSIQMELPIYYGVGALHLYLGCATARENQEMGKGNYVLLGHHMSNPNSLFSPLTRAKRGQKVLLTDEKYTYEYQIFENIEKVSYKEGHYLDDIPLSRKPILTMITCFGGNNTPYRRVVLAEFVKKESLSKQ